MDAQLIIVWVIHVRSIFFLVFVFWVFLLFGFFLACRAFSYLSPQLTFTFLHVVKFIYLSMRVLLLPVLGLLLFVNHHLYSSGGPRGLICSIQIGPLNCQFHFLCISAVTFYLTQTPYKKKARDLILTMHVLFKWKLSTSRALATQTDIILANDY